MCCYNREGVVVLVQLVILIFLGVMICKQYSIISKDILYFPGSLVKNLSITALVLQLDDDIDIWIKLY